MGRFLLGQRRPCFYFVISYKNINYLNGTKWTLKIRPLTIIFEEKVFLECFSYFS